MRSTWCMSNDRHFEKKLPPWKDIKCTIGRDKFQVLNPNFLITLHIVLRNLTPSLLHLLSKVFKNNGEEVIVGYITCTTHAYFDLIHWRRWKQWLECTCKHLEIVWTNDFSTCQFYVSKLFSSKCYFDNSDDQH